MSATSAAARKRVTYRPSMELVPGVLAGRIPAIARMISRAEANYPEAAEALAEIYKHTGKAHIVGITGVPGAGKSTLVSTLIKAFTGRGCKVGVIAIDPSSPFSGGAVLGDRVRMSDAAEEHRSYVRSMATRGHLGGLASATLQAVDVLDAAGFSPILVETVGVGQDEVEIMSAAHTVAVLSAPGLGDDVQAIKAGILEIADIHAVSKADKPEAAAAVAAIQGMMALGHTPSGSSWTPPVLAVSALSGKNVDELVDAVFKHYEHLRSSGELAARQRAMSRTRILSTARNLFQQKFDDGTGALDLQLETVVGRQTDPTSAARALLGWA
jgi:LAO/AO transport system kinase